MRTSAVLRQMQHVLGPNLLRLVNLCLSAAFIAHLVACFFYYAAYVSGEADRTWVHNAVLRGLLPSDAPPSTKYITSLYWTMSTLGTVGYGDIVPGTSQEKAVAMISILVGLTIFAYFMSSMGSLLGTLNSGNTQASRKMQVSMRWCTTTALFRVFSSYCHQPCITLQ